MKSQNPKKQKCEEKAIFYVPYKGKIYRYCPAHTNLFLLAMKEKKQNVELFVIPKRQQVFSCESVGNPLNDKELKFNTQYHNDYALKFGIDK